MLGELGEKIITCSSKYNNKINKFTKTLKAWTFLAEVH